MGNLDALCERCGKPEYYHWNGKRRQYIPNLHRAEKGPNRHELTSFLCSRCVVKNKGEEDGHDRLGR